MANAMHCEACGSDVAATEGPTNRVRVTTAGISASLHLCPSHIAMVATWIARAAPEQTKVVTDGFPRLRDDEDREVVRQWAEAHGLPVARTGTISARILAAYRDAHPVAVDVPPAPSEIAPSEIAPTDRTVVLDTAPRVTAPR